MKKRSIKGLRYDAELSQVEMAKKLNIPVASYQRYENYEAKIPADVLVKIADMFAITDVREIRYK